MLDLQGPYFWSEFVAHLLSEKDRIVGMYSGHYELNGAARVAAMDCL